jgi:transposase
MIPNFTEKHATLPEVSLLCFIFAYIELIDLQELTYKTGRPRISRKIMLKCFLLQAYFGIASLRKLQRVDKVPKVQGLHAFLSNKYHIEISRKGVSMLHKQSVEGRYQISTVTLDELVPQDHLVRKIENAIDFSFIYDLVEDRYCLDNGRPSVDPVVLIKIALIQYLFGIRSMRQTIKEIETNIAYRWFLGYDFTQPIPHFTTFGKNYVRRFQGTNLFEQIFTRILEEVCHHGFVDPGAVHRFHPCESECKQEKIHQATRPRRAEEISGSP